MPHSASSPCHSRYDSRHDSGSLITRGRTLVMAAMLGVSSVVAPAAWAQDATPEASPAAATPAAAQEADVNVLMSATFEEFPPAPMTVRMLRITLEPGASTPMHTHPGPEFDLIEAGELTVRSAGEAPVVRNDGTEEVSTGEDIVLATGDSIMFPPEVGMYYINNGEEPVVMLSAVMLPVGTAYPRSITYTEGQPTSDQFTGVDFVVLGDGLIQDMPDAPVEITIANTTVPAGADLPASTGIAMYSQIEGNFSFIVEDGMVQVSRSELESLQPNAVAGEEFILEQGDAAFFPAGVAATPRDGESGELSLLTLEMTFGEELAQEPAALTFTSGASAAGDATGGPETDAEEDAATSGVIGQIGVINSEFVNLRAEPSTTADVVDQLSTGVEVEIVGGPAEAEELTWYEVQVNAEGGSRGWMSAEFVDGIEAEAQPEADAEAAAETTPTPAADGETGAIASGDVVQITEDTVRVRSEGNLGGEIINTYNTGTQFEVTGEPVDADGYTWYPVTLVDDPSVTGWVPADFVEPAP